MSIESLLARIRAARQGYGLFTPSGASAEAISAVARQFAHEFEYPLPHEYQHLLAISDGVLENGLVIWPCAPYWEFAESVIAANRDLRENIDDTFIYLGQRDDSVFVVEPSSGRHLAIELNGLAIWKEFMSSEEAFEFMLERALAE